MFKVSKDKVKDKPQILYLLEMHIDDKVIVKIGITGRDIADRVVEITQSCFASYRYFPYVRPKRFRKVDDAFKYEQMLLEYFSKWAYKSEHRFSGSTELVEVPLEDVVEMYEYLLEKGELPECGYKDRGSAE